jgi:hypothetical protein
MIPRMYDPDAEALSLNPRSTRLVSAAVASVNKAFLLKRGWTRTAIKRILGEPDRKILMRRRWRNRPECRYDMARVTAAEEAGHIRFRQKSAPKVPDELVWAPGESVLASCGLCGREFGYVKPRTGRPRKFCSTRCRNWCAKYFPSG